MSKFFKILVLTGIALFALSTVAFAASNSFKSSGGGYRLELPESCAEVFRTNTAIRTVNGTKLISADVYSLPNFLSVPMKTYSNQQVKDFLKFIIDVQDFKDYKLDKTSEAKEKAINLHASANDMHVATNVATMKEKVAEAKLRAKASKEVNATVKAQEKKDGKAEETKTEPTKTISRLVLPLNDNVYNFSMKYDGPATVVRNIVLGKVYQVNPDKVLVLKVETNEAEKIEGSKLLSELANSLKFTRASFPEHNTLVAKKLGYQINLPMGWHANTFMTENLIIAKSLSTVHKDNSLIRTFKTDQYAELANADPKNLKTVEAEFVKKITQYTPNVTVIRHKPVTIDGLNGSIVESTDSVDLKKVFVLNAYLFDKKGIGYQMRFNTDDTINYDLKLKAFENSINSFKLLKK